MTEVRRHYGTGGGRQKLSRPWWLRLAPALGVVMVLAGGVWMMFRSEPDPAYKMAAHTQISPRLSAETVSEAAHWQALSGMAIQPPSDSLARSDALAPLAAFDAPGSPSVLDVGTPLADGSESPALHDDVPAARQRYLTFAPPPASLAMPTAPSDPTPPARTETAEDGRADTLAARRTVTMAPTVGREADSPAMSHISPPLAVNGLSARQAVVDSTEVLQNFVVVQAGQHIRFIDADGSTYEGSLQPVAGHAVVQSETSGDQWLLRAARPAQEVAQTQPAERRTQEPHGNHFIFQAAGTNRSLQQAVNFEGTLLLTEQQVRLGRNTFSNALTPAQQRVAERFEQQQTPPWGGRVQGVVRLENGSALNVDALPVAP